MLLAEFLKEVGNLILLVVVAEVLRRLAGKWRGGFDGGIGAGKRSWCGRCFRSAHSMI